MNRNRLLNWRHGVLAAGLALSFGVAGAGAGPITINDDLDGDGNNEVAKSFTYQPFTGASGGGTVSFRFMFLTSEDSRPSSSEDSIHDLFRIQLRPNGGAVLPIDNNQVDGAVVRDGDTYSGDFAEYNFGDDNVDVDGAITIPAGGEYGLSNRTVLTDGGIGWQTVSFEYSEAFEMETLILEFLVAGSQDSDYDSALFIADVADTGGLLHNGRFDEDPLNDDWVTGGNYGIYEEIDTADGGTVTADDGNIMVLSTSNTTTVPEPSTGMLLLGLAGLAATGRRRRR